MQLCFLLGALSTLALVNGACQPGYFECATSGQCIPEGWVCDGDNDCGDRSDEPETCPACASGRWECGNGNCIPAIYICDGDNDCGDGSDELDPSTGKCPNCPDSHFQCPASGRCKARSDTCDGVNDCGDWSDETEEACPCAQNEHRCEKEGEGGMPGACIPPEWICDRIYDCPLKDDEADCPDKSVRRRYSHQRQNSLKLHKLLAKAKAQKPKAKKH